MKRIDVVTKKSKEYELLDSGEGRKLERFNMVVTDRPDPQVLWQKTNPSLWTESNAQFVWAEKGERWKTDKGTPQSWPLHIEDITLMLSLKGFKHVGAFPEHAPQWQEIRSLGEKHTGLRMLNLFGYTGAASIAGSLSGINVTHVDASKTTIAIVKENIAASGLPADAMRIICDDAMQYAKRLVKRGETFDVIVMDPPAFGRGPKGEVWKIEESLPELLSLTKTLLSENAKCVILNGYAAEYSARTFGELLAGALPFGEITYGDIGLEEGSGRVLTTGIYAKWSR